MRQPRVGWKRWAALLLGVLPVVQTGTCLPTAVRDSITTELVRSTSSFVFENTQTIFYNLFGV